MRFSLILISFFILPLAALAQGVNIPQLPSQSSVDRKAADESSLQLESGGNRTDHQVNVLHNSTISEFGRANTVITQSGHEGVLFSGTKYEDGKVPEKAETAEKPKETQTGDVLVDRDGKPLSEKKDTKDKKKKKDKNEEEEKYKVPSEQTVK